MPQARARPFELVVFDWKGTLEPKLLKKEAREKIALNKLELLLKQYQQRFPKVSLFREVYAHQKKEILEKEKEVMEKSGFVSVLTQVLNRSFDVLEISNDQKLKNELSQIFFDEYHMPPERNLLYPGTFELLERLRTAQVPIALLRNTKGAFVDFEKTLIRFGVSKYFNADNVVIAGDVGVQKPNKLIFQSLLNKCNMNELHQRSPEKILMVGNETIADILGAKQMGWKAVLMLTTEPHSGGLADWECKNLHELQNLLFPEEITLPLLSLFPPIPALLPSFPTLLPVESSH